jgi:hypothetical protein
MFTQIKPRNPVLPTLQKWEKFKKKSAKWNKNKLATLLKTKTADELPNSSAAISCHQ